MINNASRDNVFLSIDYKYKLKLLSYDINNIKVYSLTKSFTIENFYHYYINNYNPNKYYLIFDDYYCGDIDYVCGCIDKYDIENNYVGTNLTLRYIDEYF